MEMSLTGKENNGLGYYYEQHTRSTACFVHPARSGSNGMALLHRRIVSLGEGLLLHAMGTSDTAGRTCNMQTVLQMQE